MLFNSYSCEILYEQFRWIYLQRDIKLLLVTVNNRLKFEIKIVHDLSSQSILQQAHKRNLPKLKLLGTDGDWNPKLAAFWLFWSTAAKGEVNKFWATGAEFVTAAKIAGPAPMVGWLPNANTGLADVTAELNPLGWAAPWLAIGNRVDGDCDWLKLNVGCETVVVAFMRSGWVANEFVGGLLPKTALFACGVGKLEAVQDVGWNWWVPNGWGCKWNKFWTGAAVLDVDVATVELNWLLNEDATGNAGEAEETMTVGKEEGQDDKDSVATQFAA